MALVWYGALMPAYIEEKKWRFGRVVPWQNEWTNKWRTWKAEMSNCSTSNNSDFIFEGNFVFLAVADSNLNQQLVICYFVYRAVNINIVIKPPVKIQKDTILWVVWIVCVGRGRVSNHGLQIPGPQVPQGPTHCPNVYHYSLFIEKDSKMCSIILY